MARQVAHEQVGAGPGKIHGAGRGSERRQVRAVGHVGQHILVEVPRGCEGQIGDGLIDLKGDQLVLGRSLVADDELVLTDVDRRRGQLDGEVTQRRNGGYMGGSGPQPAATSAATTPTTPTNRYQRALCANTTPSSREPTRCDRAEGHPAGQPNTFHLRRWPPSHRATLSDGRPSPHATGAVDLERGGEASVAHEAPASPRRLRRQSVLGPAGHSRWGTPASRAGCW